MCQCNLYIVALKLKKFLSSSHLFSSDTFEFKPMKIFFYYRICNRNSNNPVIKTLILNRNAGTRAKTLNTNTSHCIEKVMEHSIMSVFDSTYSYSNHFTKRYNFTKFENIILTTTQSLKLTKYFLKFYNDKLVH